MNALNIMWLLNDVNCNTCINIIYERNKHEDSINISTNDYSFTISEYGSCTLNYHGQVDGQQDKDTYRNVLRWVKKYYSEII